MKAAQRVLADVYRLHHVPLRPITLQTLIARGPRIPPPLVETLHDNAEELQKVEAQRTALLD